MNGRNELRPRYVVITPVRNEEEHLEKTIRSVVGQTIKPAEWVIVNDGSTDRTSTIIERYEEQYEWIRGLNRADRGFRKTGGGVIEAFNDGFNSLSAQDWDFVVKLDGDLSFEPDYFEKLFKHFQDEPELGIAGGTLYSPSNGEMKIERNPQFHVRGATKVYRRECWEQIGGLWTAPGWDTVDEVRANMLGWRTMSAPDVFANHHRVTGGADGRWRTSVKHGLICYSVGYHPLFILATCLYRLGHKPFALRSVGTVYGYILACLSRAPRVKEVAFIKFIRNEQLKRLTGRQTIWK